ncbi:MAG: rhodanese-related sulfurtransferase [Synechococcales cyanobacterium RM1_1_8]|nr:rhodanese-related sulfurtransferase [Synechococcales cyanobacterium RM1_1_8]
MAPNPYLEITVEALAQRLAEAEPGTLQLIDVREPQEAEIVSLEGFELLPLSQAQQWAGQVRDRFNPTTETLVLCHHGLRSAQMCQWLASQGFTQVKNISGGIDAYARRIDSALALY